MKTNLLTCALLVALMAAACAAPLPSEPLLVTAIANPASENCVEMGGTLEIRQAAGGEIGVCHFLDGSVCEEWALMRGECQPGQQFEDAFAYCLTAGTVAAPDARYVGPARPDAVAEGLRAVIGAAADAPMTASVWRCADGELLGCFVGANLPCQEKADLSETPNQGIIDYCQENPAAENVPAAAAGRATVYEWRCQDGEPAIVQQLFTADGQGFIADFWYPIAQP